ncbi:NAD-dependent epimerase/dehydratase family protein [Spongiivirga sp. MCCC 1A20706]|uniref:NAD-dependent epimerase/dehydratase family protein n=1 Tax=Spongiivirga sp. MCCC 1A20706 TaxID=3160963 RepID=UPI0039775ACD
MILVTGATGLVGSHLLAKLLLSNTQVRAIYRTEKKRLAVKKIIAYYSDASEVLFDKIDWIQADINDITQLSKAFEQINIVYHCAAVISFDESFGKHLRKVNIEGTANIVNLCLSNRIKKLCYTSSIATLGLSDNNEPITEETHWNPEAQNNIYAITKYGAELEVWRASQEGLNTVIVNPGVILGSGFWDEGSGQLVKHIASGFKYYTMGSVGYVDVEDVVQAMIKLVEGGIINERFILVSENKSFKEVFSMMATSLGVKPPSVLATNWMLGLAWRFDKLTHFLFRKKRGFFKASAISATQELDYSNQKIKKALGFEFTPLDKTIKKVTRYYLAEASQQ